MTSQVLRGRLRIGMSVVRKSSVSDTVSMLQFQKSVGGPNPIGSDVHALMALRATLGFARGR
jgi:hypothetical protein